MPSLVANNCRVALDQVNPPPAGVAAEKCDVPAIFDKLRNVVAHRLAPVFVVTDAEEKPVSGEAIAQVFMEVEISAVIDREAFAF